MEKLLPNYHRCLTNISSSILHRFGIDDPHTTINEIDQIIYNYKKVIFVFFDGMGSCILDKHLNENSFILQNKICDLTSVFPPTTAAATTALLSGKNPNETGWLGWHLYFKDIDEDLCLFSSTGYYNLDYFNDGYTYTKLPYISIVDQIKNKGYLSLRIDSFNGYQDLNVFSDKIVQFANQNSEGFLYAYYTEPDHLMHEFGVNDESVHQKISAINNALESIYQRIDNDTLIIVSADHGLVDVQPINLYYDEDIKNNLIVPPYCDARVNMFKVKDKEKFVRDFKHKYGGAFDLYSKKEIIDQKLFGNMKNSEVFLELLGDFVAIGKDRYYLSYANNEDLIFKAHHSGYSKDEMMIPLILLHK